MAAKNPSMKAVAASRKQSRKTLEMWRSEGCPGLPPAAYDKSAVDAWAKANGKRSGNVEAGDARQEKLQQEIRKLKLANDAREGRLIERGFVAAKIMQCAGDLNSYRSSSESEHPLKFAAAAGDVPACRTLVQEIWDYVFNSLQAVGKNFAGQ